MSERGGHMPDNTSFFRRIYDSLFKPKLTTNSLRAASASVEPALVGQQETTVSINDVASMVALTYEGGDKDQPCEHLRSNPSWVFLERVPLGGHMNLRLDIWNHKDKLVYNYAIRGTTAADTWLMNSTVAMGNMPAWYLAAWEFIEPHFLNVTTKHYSEKPSHQAPQFFVSGHSMGACAAELIAAKRDIPAVTFESTGIEGIMTIYGLERMIAGKRVVSILSAPNPINTCYGHLGKVFRVFVPHVWSLEETSRYQGICALKSAAGVLVLAAGVGAFTRLAGRTSFLGMPLGKRAVQLTAACAAGAAVVGACAVGSYSWAARLEAQHSMGNMLDFAFSSPPCDDHNYIVRSFFGAAGPQPASSLRLAMQSWPQRPADKGVLPTAASQAVREIASLSGMDSEGALGIFSPNATYEERVQQTPGYNPIGPVGDAEINNTIAEAMRKPVATPLLMWRMVSSAEETGTGIRDLLHRGAQQSLPILDELVKRAIALHNRLNDFAEESSEGLPFELRAAQPEAARAVRGLAAILEVFKAVTHAEACIKRLDDLLKQGEPGEGSSAHTAFDDCVAIKARLEQDLETLPEHKTYFFKAKFQQTIARLESAINAYRRL